MVVENTRRMKMIACLEPTTLAVPSSASLESTTLLSLFGPRPRTRVILFPYAFISHAKSIKIVKQKLIGGGGGGR